MLKGFDPPGEERARSLQRLRAHLRSHLTAEAMTRIEPALRTLGSVTHIRNAGQHMDAATDAATALPTLGLAYPITDFDHAWQTVRAHVTQALGIIREEIYASLPSSPRRRAPRSGTSTPSGRPRGPHRPQSRAGDAQARTVPASERPS
jgi:hypothetical protein